MYLKKAITAICLLAAVQTLSAQIFLQGNFTFSGKKPSIVNLENGTKIEGTIEDLDRQKGLIEQVIIKDAQGKKHKLKPEQIKSMYLAPSGWDKFAKSYDFLNDATQWGVTDLDKDIIGKGFAYFEKTEVKLSKSKTETLMLQLLNPSFSNKIKIYFDPRTKETMSLGIAGVKLVGGIAKSYYVKKGNEIAYKLEKKNYEDEFKSLYEDCAEILTKYAKMSWSELETHIFEHSRCAKN